MRGCRMESRFPLAVQGHWTRLVTFSPSPFLVRGRGKGGTNDGLLGSRLDCGFELLYHSFITLTPLSHSHTHTK